MKEIIDIIDEAIETCTEDVKFYGLCHQLEDDSESVYPATVELQATKAVPDDSYDITIYHRLLDGDYAPVNEVPFGRNRYNRNTQRVRTIVFIKIGVDTHTKIEDIINLLPDKITVSGYDNVIVSGEISLLRDRSAIWEDEYGEAYKDKYQSIYHLYALEYDVLYTKCPVCVTT